MNKGSRRFDLTDGRDENSIGEGKHRRKAGPSITWRENSFRRRLALRPAANKFFRNDSVMPFLL
jgi:hypothetical protein